ncbi:MAG TPA: ATP synthase F0 subunit B, partial [Acidimicrobiales bacterium]
MRTRVVLTGGAVVGLSLLDAAPALAVQDNEDSTVDEESEGAEEHGEFADHAAEECAHMLAEGEPVERCQQSPNPIMPAMNELIFGGLAFLILLVVMWKKALPAVQKGMVARTQTIRDNLDEAERTKAEAQRILEEYQHQLADSKNESARIIEEARQTAEQMRRDLMARAESEVQELRSRTQEDLRAAQDRAMAALRAQVA